MSGTLRLLPGAPPPKGPPGRTAPAARSRRRPSWAADPLDALAEEMAEVCAAAVHPDEIAAHLESEGLTGEQIQRRYGRRDTFEAAAELFARVPRAFPEPPPAPDPWRGDPGTALLRGLVFTLPGLGYALAAPFLTGPPDRLGLPAGTGALAASALAAWAWNQALAHRAYAALAAGGRAAAGRVLRAGAPAGAPIALAAALATAALLPAPGAAQLFAAGQAVYLAAATVLLVLGRERLLLFALLPLALGAAALPLLPPEAAPAAVRAVLPAAAVCAAVAAAVRETVRAVREGTGADGAAADGAADSALPARRASVPYGLFGLGCGVLTALAALGETLWHGAGAAPAGPVVVALSLSMGAAEWLLYRCRSLALAALARSTTAAGLRWRAAGALGVCLAGYLAALAALLLATAALWPGGPPADPARLPAVLALGAVLWTGLLLQAFGAARAPAAVTAAAALCAAAPLWLRPGLAGPDAVLTAVCATAALVLLATAAALLGRITTHR
ncbi:hypothetical protein GCM10023079_36330 [Streptomyces chitinivorans]|uniref:hypothetical protein n=1 Tax=Streptomyces chitinivorans TaxID=1257027 RepID=UPI0031EA670A